MRIKLNETNLKCNIVDKKIKATSLLAQFTSYQTTPFTAFALYFYNFGLISSVSILSFDQLADLHIQQQRNISIYLEWCL